MLVAAIFGLGMIMAPVAMAGHKTVASMESLEDWQHWQDTAPEMLPEGQLYVEFFAGKFIEGITFKGVENHLHPFSFPIYFIGNGLKVVGSAIGMPIGFFWDVVRAATK